MSPHTAVAARIEAGARDLAQRVEAGAFATLRDDQRFFLRRLAMTLLESAGDLREPPPPPHNHLLRAARLFGLSQ